MSTFQLVKATASTCPQLQGFTFIPVDLDRLHQFTMTAIGDSIHYTFGGKDPNIGSGLVDFKNGIDCSGWNQTSMDFYTHSILKRAGFPDGSANQADWLIAKGFKYHVIRSASDYLSSVAKDGLLRIATHKPNGRGGDSVGHVIEILFDTSDPKFSLGNEPVTDESYGHHGPGIRPYTHQWFLNHIDYVFVIGPLVSTSKWFDTSTNPYASILAQLTGTG